MQRVIIVHLRRPRSRTDKPDEKRSDPFWEYGSFGLTGCHGENLMHPKNADRLDGVRFAFAQGGRRGTKLVHLTPPVKIVRHRNRIEATWSPKEMPFRYDRAPILASNEHLGDFSRLESSVMSIRRQTREGQFSSKFRSRASCIPDEIAREIIDTYDGRRRNAKKENIARSYHEALPWEPPLIDKHRHQTYTELLSAAGEIKAPQAAGSRRPKGPCGTRGHQARRCR
jgi:hypothetical protein